MLGEQNGGSTDMLIIADDFNLAANFCHIWFETCHSFHIHIECTWKMKKKEGESWIQGIISSFIIILR